VTLDETTHRDTANSESKEDRMEATRKLGLVFCMAILVVTFGSPVKADEHDKLTILTFSAPVELPGNVVLSAGTYVFKILDIPSTRNVVEILNQEQTQICATILTIPAERLRQTDKTIVEFYQPGPSAPSALKSWFYPGNTQGQEFVYPRARAAELTNTAIRSVTVSSSNLTSSHEQP